MCARYTLRKRAQIIIEAFEPLIAQINPKPRYNIAPTQDIPVVRTNSQGDRELVLMRWGLVPSWADDLSIGQRLINARAETIADKPAFRQAFKQRRCLIPADGFYEWRQVNKEKQPTFIHRNDDGMFAFAGLWESWTNRSSGEVIQSATILTTTPNKLVEPIHDRMPVILDRAEYEKWLDPKSEPASLTALLDPYTDSELTSTPVGKLVNNPRNEDPNCIEPLSSETLFG